MRRLVMLVIVLSAAATMGCRDCYQSSPCSPYQATCAPSYRQQTGTQMVPVYSQQQGCVPCCR